MKEYLTGFPGSLGIIGMLLIIVLTVILPIPAKLTDVLIVLNILLAFSLFLIVRKARNIYKYSKIPLMIILTAVLNLATAIAIMRIILIRSHELTGSFTGAIAGFIPFYGLFSIIPVICIYIICYFFMFVFNKKISIQITETANNTIGSKTGYCNKLDASQKFIDGNFKLLINISLLSIIVGIIIGTNINAQDIKTAVSNYSSLSISSGLIMIIPTFVLSITSKTAFSKLKRFKYVIDETGNCNPLNHI